MSEIRKIVVENYPAHKLPEDLRRGLDQHGNVRVTVEPADSEHKKPLASFVGSGKGCYQAPDDAIAAIRTLREESRSLCPIRCAL